MASGIGAYRFNSDTFAFEVFDEEIVALNVVDGIYYAFGGAAAAAWPYLVAQHSVPTVASALAARYAVLPDELARDLAAFVERLVGENILVTAPEGISVDAPEIAGLPPASAQAYEGFLFERHADMEDLLTLDPIHDVDPSKGWPNT